MNTQQKHPNDKPGQNIILVTGATGNVGRHVVSQLLEKGAYVRALSRNPAAANLPPDVEVAQADLSFPETLNRHLEAVSAVFLLWRSSVIDTVPAILDALAKHARRIVFLSSLAVRDGEEQQDNLIAKWHADIEHSIEKSGMDWTIVRPGAFATNSLQWWAPQIRVGDVVRWPFGTATLAPIDERDIAAVAVRALTESGYEGGKYALTGPAALTQAEQVEAIGEVIGRALRLEEITPHAARQQMLGIMPPQIVDLLLDTWARIADQPATVTNTVEEVTGAPAHTFRDWVSNHAGDFQLASENSGSGASLPRSYSPSSTDLASHQATGRVRTGADENPLVIISSDFPDITRSDAGSVTVTEWKTGTLEQQNAAIEVLTEVWKSEPWPASLLSVNLFVSTDGQKVLNYAQWTLAEEFSDFMRTELLRRDEKLPLAVTGIERKGSAQYKLYRSCRRENAPAPGCVVIVSVEFAGPNQQRQRRWVDTVFNALDAEPELPAGGISGYFHVSLDGGRVLNYATWTDEKSHRDALEGSGQGTIGRGPKWLEVKNFPGVASNGFRRYRLIRSLSEGAKLRAKSGKVVA